MQMKNIFFTLTFLLLIGKIIAQPLVPPCPYCWVTYGNQPCNNPGPSNAPGNFINDFINSFNTTGAVNNIVNNNSGCNSQNFPGIGVRNYFNHGCNFILRVNPGQNITCNVQSGNVYSQGFAIFVDWNQDGTFINGAPEKVAVTPSGPAGVFMATNFIVPAAQANGNYRMRVRAAYATSGAGIDPCTQYGYGETEDYTLIVGPGACQAVGVLTASVTESYAICTRTLPSTNALTLTALTTETSAVTYSWTGPNGFSSVVNSSVIPVLPPLPTPTVSNYITTVQITPTTVVSTNYLMVPNPSTLASGIYTLNLTGGPATCPATKTVNIRVLASPTINLLTSNSPTCSTGTIIFTNNVAPVHAPGSPTQSTIFNWNGPNAFSSNIQTPNIPNASQVNSGTYSATTTNNYTVSLVSSILTNGANLPLLITNSLTCPNNSTTPVVIIQTNPVTVIAAPANTLCQGATLNLSANALGANSYSWSGPAGFNSTQQSPSFANIMPISSGNYTATALFTVPNSTLVCTRTLVSNYSVVPTSPVQISLTNNVCQFGTATLSAVAAGATGFNWFGPNNFTSTDVSPSITNIQPIASGPYFATAMFSIGTVSCTTQGTNNISVVPVNSITVLPQISACEPANINLQASSIGATTYSWSGPLTYTSNLANPSIFNLLPPASGVYTVFTSYNNGILTCYNTNTTNLTVNPKLNFTLTPYTLACSNANLNINGPVGATAYSWTSTNGFTTNTQNLTIPNVQFAQEGTYNLEVSLGPCKTYGSTFVEVLSPIQFSTVPNSRSICRGDSVNLVMNSIGGSGNYAYVWNPPLYISSPTGSVQQGNPLGTTVYNVTGYDIACPNYTINHAFTIDVKQPPMPNLKLQKEAGCQPLCLFLDSKTQSEAAITTWDFGGNLQMQADSFSYCLENPGTYKLRILSKGTNGCSGVYTYPAPIVVHPKPGAEITWSPELVTLTDNVVTFNPVYSKVNAERKTWSFLGTTIAGVDSTNQTNPQRVYENVGKFPVMLVASTDLGCTDSVVKFIEVVEDFNVFIPNSFTPNGDGINDNFLVKGTGMKLENYTCEIFDRWGNSVFFTKDITKGWDGVTKGQKNEDGVYIYKIKIVGANGQGKKEFVGHVTLLK